MWMKVTVKSDIMLLDLMKKHKNTSIEVILKYPKNAAAAKAHKAQKPIPKGTIVWLLDPKAIVFISTLPNGQKEVVTEKQYWESKKKIDKALDVALKQHKLIYETLCYRHRIQNEALDEFWITSQFTASWWGEEGREPKKQLKNATAAYKKLKTVVNARKYSKFKSAVLKCDKAFREYGKGIDSYASQHTGSAENWENFAVVVRDLGFVTVGALAMTVAAPATAAATLGYGTLVGSGTAFLSTSANEAGRHISGQNITFTGSAKRVASEMLQGAILGAVSAGIAKYLSGFVLKHLGKRLLNPTAISKLISGESKFFSSLGKRAFERESEALIKTLSKGTNEKIAREMLQRMWSEQIFKKVVSNVTVKLSTRFFVGGSVKLLRVYGLDAFIESYIKENASNIKGGTDDNKIAEDIAKKFGKDPKAKEMMKKVLKVNEKEIEKEVGKEMRKEMERRIKQLEKQK